MLILKLIFVNDKVGSLEIKKYDKNYNKKVWINKFFFETKKYS